MNRLKTQDLQQVIQLFENELCTLPKVSRVDKMKLRKKISNALMPLLNDPNANTDAIIRQVDKKLEGVTSLFFDAGNFKSKLAHLLNDRLGR